MYVRVALARPMAGLLTYAAPPATPLALGHVVLVPLGRVGETGYVVETMAEPDIDASKVRSVTRLLDPEPAFDTAQLSFFRWVARYYLAPLGAVIHTALPSRMRAGVVSVLHPTDAGVEALGMGEVTGPEALVLREVIARRGLTRRGLAQRLRQEIDGKATRRASNALVRHGWAEWGEKEVREGRGRVRTVVLSGSLAERSPRAGKRMRAVAEFLGQQDGVIDVAEVVAAHGANARAALKRLEAAGVVTFGEREERDRLAAAPPLGASEPPPLNPDQQAAVAALDAPGAKGAFLLHGVTGSGKTEVFLHAARTALDRGQQVVVLVPEIGLTPQLVGRFRARFGGAVAVLHSGLTGAERLAEWRRLRAGDARIAVGARSALFAPLDNLGLVVVDEEHDDSYKQDEGVRYNARDLAVVLAREHGCVAVLASATPSMESWYNAQRGLYTRLGLPRRATPRPVPSVELVDMSAIQLPKGEPRPVFAPEVVQALAETFREGGQAIVLYNRRGFATMVECASCGGTYECPSCGITMTLHRKAHIVACHYCGFRRPYDGVCPSCAHTPLDELGKGTERVEGELERLFPDVSRARMDADTTATRGAHARILDRFRSGEARLLVGTQIVAKGHDFPGVHTAVVVSADRGFRMPDFRAAERTYALVVQLAGRAGRGAVAGRVLVQTYDPEHYVLSHLDDVDSFLRTEARIRQTLRYPPFTRLCLVRLQGDDRRKVRTTAGQMVRELRERARGYGGVEVLGPAAAALPRLVGRWRFQVIVRGSRTRDLRAFLIEHHAHMQSFGRRGVRVAVDVDPRHLL